ncbi:TPA: DUF1433 domain-containing protein [Staphylococcus aureus]|uniref:DUF1433 domain-containing protein n=1 Tax=Staphylococcus aureus TaxID=1280 RepID=UPI0001FAD6B6|nr:DUF1433 domain-containing protein [Staphylococcus aureus]AUG74767.1 Membrane protein [Staphylococcus aureus O46]AVS03495.1 DUF1433 domain-containing protein [Staphylococcus aureus]AYC79105.1 Hypothetical protein SaO326_02373 [Staphylococcus aureus]EGQ0539736.1 DUF1433 domain-containing protein [Staphylococcus aureus]KIT74065.1 hypothetical protein QP71_10685 [Staphylococcus aureus]
MSKKKILILTSIILIILISVAGIHFKMKYDEKEQQERITLYLKHNTIEPNTIKSVHFTNLETSPMGSAVIEGYINENQKDNFTAYATPEHNYQFGGAMIKSEGVDKLLKPAHERKSPDDIKKELNKKKNH